MKHFLRPWFAALGAALLATACGGGGGESAGPDGGIGGTGSPLGMLRLARTDAPSCGYSAVHLSIERVRVHQSATADDTAAGWSEIVLAPTKRVNLLDLQNGVLEELGQVQLPAGQYTQLRLVLAANGGATPLANSVTPSGGSETALDTPSAQQSGLKLNLNLTVPAGQVADFVLDFDACKSVVRRGNSGRYNLKPVVAVLPRLADAGLRVQGYVAPALAAGGAQVSLQFDGQPVKATVPDPASGRFVLYPVPAGSYTLVVSASGHASAVVTGVPVVSGTPTVVNSAALPIQPPASSTPWRRVAGSVLPASATVRAWQRLSGGPVVELAWAPVDASSGAFEFSLPSDAPVRAAYVPNPVVLSFTSDTDVAGRYTVEATLDGVLKPQPIDTRAAVPELSFSFP